MLALLIGLVTVVIGCWLSDNCWSPDPEGHVITVAWPTAKKPPLSPDTPLSIVSISSSAPSSPPSSPDSDWPLVDFSDGGEGGDSNHLWHHTLCHQNNAGTIQGAADPCKVHDFIENGHVEPLETTQNHLKDGQEAL